LSSTKDLKELTILLLPPNLIQSSLCQWPWKRPRIEPT
jgi:hypothetical protein